MKLTMDVQIVANKKHLGFARKEFETNVLPFIGMEIEDTAWKEPRKILSVCISYQNDSIYVGLEEYDIFEEENFNKMKDMLKAHAWDVH